MTQDSSAPEAAPERPRRLLDETSHAFECSVWIRLESEGDRQMKHDLRIRATEDVLEDRWIDFHQELTAKLLDLLDFAVMHEEPIAISERMTVGLLHRRERCGADVSQEQWRLDVRREVA